MSENQAQLFKSIAEVMKAIERVPKNGYNDFHRYHYATEADVSDALRRELSKRDVAVFVGSRIVQVREWQTPKGKPTLLTDIECDVTFACGKTGAQMTVTAVGTGDDPSDKGTYKAITGAVKYALLKTFLVPTGDDPEQVAEHQREKAKNLDAAFAGQAAVKKPAEKTAVQAIADTFNATPTEAAKPDTATLDSYTFKFGKHKGKKLSEVDESYLKWLLSQPAKAGYEQQHAEAHALYQAELDRRVTA